MRHATLATALVLTVAISTTGCGRGPWLHELHGQTMGTTYTVKVVLPGALRGSERQAFITDIAERVEREFAQVNAAMSLYREDSELSRLNAAAAGVAFSVSPDLFDVLSLAQQVSEETGGAFDVTVAPAVDMWGFGPGGPKELPPPQGHLNAISELVDFRHLVLDSEAKTVTKRVEHATVDLGGIAKGYGTDRAAEGLEDIGCEHYMVEIGGEVRTAGLNREGAPWRIGVEQPDPGGRAVRRVVPLSGGAMATSGDYRSFFELDGVRYSHTIDPRTLRPVAHEIASVTVLHDRCVLADAYATAFFVLGPHAGPATAEQLGVAALFIMRDEDGVFSERATTGFPPAANYEDGS